MRPSFAASWLLVIAAVTAQSAIAQPASETSDVAASTPAPALRYRSAFDHYQPFADAKPIPWAEANAIVHHRGGWKAYAQEASTDAPEAASHTPPGPAMPMPAPAKKEQP